MLKRYLRIADAVQAVGYHFKSRKKSTTQNIHAVISAFGRDWLPNFAEFWGDYRITGKRRKGLTEKRKCKIVTKEGKWGIYQSEREAKAMPSL